ncbi:AsmA family protein [Brevibacillus migulae]|uniref:hypothetical protein n=1 Tax=Brevibacillus migulae TaxID=1644114 RepID=UPI001431ACE3|nr:hypothetical protein [Brevibacillus migulae]
MKTSIDGIVVEGTVEEIFQLLNRMKQIEKQKEKVSDHALDALRYGIQTRIIDDSGKVRKPWERPRASFIPLSDDQLAKASGIAKAPVIDDQDALFMPGFAKRMQDARELINIQGENGNWNYDHYMHGIYNGMEMILSTIEGREPNFRSPPDKWISNGKTTWDERLKEANWLLEIQGQDGTWDEDPFTLGMYNGMEAIVATMEGRDPVYRDEPSEWVGEDEIEEGRNAHEQDRARLSTDEGGRKAPGSSPGPFQQDHDGCGNMPSG